MVFRWTTTEGLFGAIFAACLAVSVPAGAQAPDELKAARELFQDAYRDEQARRFPEALEKFLRVARVRESAAVRYRIAAVQSAMGRYRDAREGYRALAASRASLPASDQEIADDAAERALEVDRKIARLLLRVTDHGEPRDVEGVRATVDGAPVAVPTSSPLELDPGAHLVAASAPNRAPYEHRLVLAEGTDVAHVIDLQPTAPATLAAAPVAEPKVARGDPLPWIVLGGGGALVVAGTAFLVLREGAISDVRTTCPNGVCAARDEDEVESDRTRAQVFGPVGVGLGVVGLGLMGLGIYLASSTPSAPVRSTGRQLPRLAAGPGALRLTF